LLIQIFNSNSTMHNIYLQIYIMEKNVRFNDVIIVIEEPEELAEDLSNSRKSNWAQRKLDIIRMETLLKPILDKHHRKKIYNTLFANV
jgi:hypothetical protein